MTKNISLLFFVAAFPILTFAQHPWQKPAFREPAEVSRIIGTFSYPVPERELNIVWVWGVDKNHEREAHEYGWVMDRYVDTLLPTIPRVHAESAMYMPTDEQWEKADLIVFYVQFREPWSEHDYQQMDTYLARGGGLMFFHLALLQGSGVELAQRIGLSYGVQNAPNGPTQWGPLSFPVRVTAQGSSSPIMAGFPAEIEMMDELYWNLQGDTDDIDVLMTASAGTTGSSESPNSLDQLDDMAWPVVWTKQQGQGRIFATVLGHNYFTFNDPYFRIIVLRAMAWTMHESFDPFKPLVMQNLQR